MFASSVSPTSTPPSPGSILSESPSSVMADQDVQVPSVTNNVYKKKSSVPSKRELFFQQPQSREAEKANEHKEMAMENKQQQDNNLIYVEEISTVARNDESRL